MVYKCFDIKSASRTDKSAKAGDVNNEVKQNEQIAEQSQKPIIKRWGKEQFILHLKTIFEVLIKLICINKQA